MDSTVKRGDIFYADLSPVVGSEQGGTRPVLIVQNDTGNRHSPTVIAAAITSQTGKAKLPTHINIAGGSVGLSKDSVILLEQIRTIDKRRLREHMGRLDDQQMSMVDNAIAVSFGLHGNGAMPQKYSMKCFSAKHATKSTRVVTAASPFAGPCGAHCPEPPRSPPSPGQRG